MLLPVLCLCCTIHINTLVMDAVAEAQALCYGPNMPAP